MLPMYGPSLSAVRAIVYTHYARLIAETMPPLSDYESWLENADLSGWNIVVAE